MDIRNMLFQRYGEMVNSNDDSSVQHWYKVKGYRNGAALRNHCASAHEGQLSENCNACIEIQARMCKLGVDVSPTNKVEII